MDINKMRMGLAYIFTENMKLAAKTKTQLINFIEDADLQQLKILAMDGEIVPKDQLNESTRSIVDDRFSNQEVIAQILSDAALKGIKVAIDLKKQQ